MTILEGNLNGLVALIMTIMFGPPLLFSIIGFLLRKKSPKVANIFFILAGVYIIIGIGICGGFF
ncbi:hypothetical protein PG593_01415 [Riemerella anatipestifer]|uniref:hypothetical protein n=1 Tax=Riemerella anatipestifer TaxID=34085 RepID=UPI0012AD7DC5|nr:hypothetical protein [Riemerella anatipestifer]MDY3528434.1 hypothetical protein [Riemerella anatipestifer]USL94672.1 hypothetical protein D1J36_005015 [Riemerella anatipestifer]